MSYLLSQSEENRQDFTLHFIVFLSAICIRIFFLIFIDEPILFFKYPFFAEKISAGVDIGERLVDLSPFYLYFLAFLKKFFGLGWDFIKCFQIFVGAINALLVFIIGNRIFQKGAAFIAALLFSFYGNLIILETTLEPTVLVLFFGLFSVYFLIISKNQSPSQTKELSIILVAGISSGLGVITKPNFLLFIPVGMIWILFFRTVHFGWKKNLLHAMLFLFAAFMVIAPITIRNFVKLNDFILVTADAGKVFFHGNSKTATAIVGADLLKNDPYSNKGPEPDYAHVIFRRSASQLSGKPLSPSQATKFWMEITFEDILGNRLLYLKRELKKFVHFFTDYEVHYIASAHKEYKESLAYPFLRYGIVVSLAFLGILLSLKNFREVFLLYGAICVYLLSCVIFLVNSRYRIPAVPYLCLFAGCAVYSFKDALIKHQIKRLGIYILLIGSVYFLSHTAFRKEINEHDQWQEATKICYEMDGISAFERGEYHTAIIALDKCVSIVPNFYPAYILRGRSYAMIGEYKNAETDFNKAISLNPRDLRGPKNIGFVYLLQEKLDAAEKTLQEVLKQDSQNKKIKEALAAIAQKKAEKGRIKP